MKVFSKHVSSWKPQMLGPGLEWGPNVQEKNCCQISLDLEELQDIHGKDLPQEGREGKGP